MDREQGAARKPRSLPPLRRAAQPRADAGPPTLFLAPPLRLRPLGSAGYNARKRARRKASSGSASGANAKARRAGGAAAPARPTGRANSTLENRRELEEAYVDTFMDGPLPAHAAGNPSFRDFLRARARSMSDEALVAHCNLSSGADDDDDEAMSRDMELAMGDMMNAMAKTLK